MMTDKETQNRILGLVKSSNCDQLGVETDQSGNAIKVITLDI